MSGLRKVGISYREEIYLMKMTGAFLGGLVGAAAGIMQKPYLKPFMRKKVKMLRRAVHGMHCGM